MENTDYPHKGHPEIEYVKMTLRDALVAIHELEALQADAVEHLVRPNPEPGRSPES